MEDKWGVHDFRAFTTQIDMKRSVERRTARKRRTGHRPTAGASGSADSGLLDQDVQQRIQYVAALLWIWRDPVR